MRRHLGIPDGEVMAWGGDPYAMEKSPYRGAYRAVVESLSRLVATGTALESAHLTFQEYASARILLDIWRKDSGRAWSFLQPRKNGIKMSKKRKKSLPKKMLLKLFL